MNSGQIRPGGDWLAYNTDQQSTSTPFIGSTPSTGYLLNLADGRRYQFAPSNRGGVGSWSPDGAWLLVSSFGAGSYLMSADMQEWIEIPEEIAVMGYPVWRADSQMLGFWGKHGGCDSPPSPGCNQYYSYLWMVDLPTRTYADLKLSPDFQALGLVREAKWSPMGSELLMITAENGGLQSRLDPSYFILSVK
jgi:Tol biopolymer transport system component